MLAIYCSLKGCLRQWRWNFASEKCWSNCCYGWCCYKKCKNVQFKNHVCCNRAICHSVILFAIKAIVALTRRVEPRQLLIQVRDVLNGTTVAIGKGGMEKRVQGGSGISHCPSHTTDNMYVWYIRKHLPFYIYKQIKRKGEKGWEKGALFILVECLHFYSIPLLWWWLLLLFSHSIHAIENTFLGHLGCFTKYSWQNTF